MNEKLLALLKQIIEGQTRIENEVRKNSIKLENIEKMITKISEVQTNNISKYMRNV